MIVFIFILLLLLVYQTKLAGIGEYFEDFLSLNISKSIKGLCAFSIILIHISQRLSDPGVLIIFRGVGHLATSLFFFYSGYGLMKSLETKEDYLNGFIIKRLPTILIPFWLINIIYIFANIILGEKYSFVSIISYITGIKLINTNAWYVITITLFYLAFYFLFKFLNKNQAILVMGVFILVYILICILQAKGHWWYISCISFFIGIVIAFKYDAFIKFIKSKYSICFGTLFLSFSAIILNKLSSRFSFIPSKVSTIIYPLTSYLFTNFIVVHDLNKLIYWLTSSCLFTIFIVVLLMKVKITNIYTQFLGTISFELYLIHNLILTSLNKVGIKNNIYYTFFCLLTSIFVAYILNIIFKKVLLEYKKIINSRMFTNTTITEKSK